MHSGIQIVFTSGVVPALGEGTDCAFKIRGQGHVYAGKGGREKSKELKTKKVPHTLNMEECPQISTDENNGS